MKLFTFLLGTILTVKTLGFAPPPSSIIPASTVFSTPLSSLSLFSIQDSSCMINRPNRISTIELNMSGVGNTKPPQNEFSRKLQTGVLRSREYTTEISANPDELLDLAKRFSLAKISKLDASVVISRAKSGHQRRGRIAARGDCIQVEGEVIASVTQTCVRTNEDFDVDLEFDLFSIVSPCGVSEQPDEIGGMKIADIEDTSRTNRKKQKKDRKRNAFRGDDQAMSQSKIRQIESLLQDVDLEDDIIEDKAILGDDGFLDFGELVSQAFRVKLEPYPRKPGTKPISISISG